MRFLLTVLAAALLALPASAQVVLWPSGLTVTDAQAAKGHDLRILHNSQACAAAALDAGCTQAELDATGKGGSVYAATTAGLQSFLAAQKLRPSVLDYPIGEDDANAIAAAKLTKAQRDAICAAFSKPSGCVIVVR